MKLLCATDEASGNEICAGCLDQLDAGLLDAAFKPVIDHQANETPKTVKKKGDVGDPDPPRPAGDPQEEAWYDHDEKDKSVWRHSKRPDMPNKRQEQRHQENANRPTKPCLLAKSDLPLTAEQYLLRP
jgi:hypothetical protein